jgi:hypothetical protein
VNRWRMEIVCCKVSVVVPNFSCKGCSRPGVSLHISSEDGGSQEDNKENDKCIGVDVDPRLHKVGEGSVPQKQLFCLSFGLQVVRTAFYLILSLSAPCHKDVNNHGVIIILCPTAAPLRSSQSPHTHTHTAHLIHIAQDLPRFALAPIFQVTFFQPIGTLQCASNSNTSHYFKKDSLLSTTHCGILGKRVSAFREGLGNAWRADTS